jgi:type IV pilus assembly protein PilN
MIKINLLSEGKRPTAVRKTRAIQPVGGGTSNTALWTLLAMVLLGAAAAGAGWWHLKSELEGVTQRVAAAQKEVDELQEVLEEVARYEKTKADLQHKISVINQLKANQRGPVRVMDYVSRALPELLWLDTMTMQPSTITLTGRAFNDTAVANFLEGLEGVLGFEEATRSDVTDRGPVYEYVISFPYTYTPLTEGAQEGAGIGSDGSPTASGAAGTTAAGG